VSLAAHADAVLSLLHADSTVTVYPQPTPGPTVVPPNTRPPYVTVHMAASRPRGDRMAMQSTKFRMRIYVHCTGATDDGARILSDWAAGLLLDVRPVIPGRTRNPIRSETEHQPPREDESTGRLGSTLTDVYVLETDAGR
jgi:hypothetical protein